LVSVAVLAPGTPAALFRNVRIDMSPLRSTFV
jgi:hypothetical protein